MITKQTVARKMLEYLRHRLSLDELVNWAENGLLEGDFPESDANLLSEVLSQIGLADVKAFGLMWEDCDAILQRLGYSLEVNLLATATK